MGVWRTVPSWPPPRDLVRARSLLCLGLLISEGELLPVCVWAGLGAELPRPEPCWEAPSLDLLLSLDVVSPQVS